MGVGWARPAGRAAHLRVCRLLQQAVQAAVEAPCSQAPITHMRRPMLLPTHPILHPAQAMRAKAKRALVRFTGAALGTLRDDDEEFLMGGWPGCAAA